MRAATSVVAIGALLACGSPAGPRVDTNPSPDAAAILRNLTIEGDPESANGARWTYREVAGATTYDLAGVLLKPAGAGPFPGAIVSHGAGGNATIYSRSVGSVMRGWGLVVIGVNYTHSGGVPIGSPGGASEQGASGANVLRARKTVDILSALPYVDPKRIAAHGHSMGAFVTSALLGAHPTLILVASHTAGGARPVNSPLGPAPDDGQVANLRTPYQLHHGDADVVVGLAADQRLASLLSARGVEHDLIVYPGASHSDVAQSDAMFTRVRGWYESHGLMAR